MTIQTVNDGLVTATRRQFVASMNYMSTWKEDGTHSAVRITLAKPEDPTEIKFRFVAFPRKQDMNPAIIRPADFLETCMLYQPCGFYTEGNDTLVILYNQTGNQPELADLLADAARRARKAVEDICAAAATLYRVEKYTCMIVQR